MQAVRSPYSDAMKTRAFTTGAAEYRAPWVQDRIVSVGTREQIIAWLVWNDPNGCYSDEDSEAEVYVKLTRESASQIMRRQIGPRVNESDSTVRHFYI
jgi:hypothetical protein